MADNISRSSITGSYNHIDQPIRGAANDTSRYSARRPRPEADILSSPCFRFIAGKAPTILGASYIEKLAADQSLTKVTAKAVVDSMLEAIGDAVAGGEEVNLPGFGKFTVKAVPARTGRNPETGAPIEIAPSKKVVFSPAKALKDKVKG